MKRICILLLCLVLLTGCSREQDGMDRAMALRSRLLGSGASFDTVITADYGDRTYTFSMACVTDSQGKLEFTVKEPELISGITGSFSADGGKLTFGDQALAFSLLADGQVSPVSGPWILMRTLRSGYLTSCGWEEGRLRLAIDDSYAEDALHLDIWLDETDCPVRGEILWKGRRILSVAVENFQFL